jgi:hypothetical protein
VTPRSPADALAPTIPAIAAPPPIAAPPGRAWLVGTPGEFDWQVTRAPDVTTAMRFWAEDQYGECDCAAVRASGDDPGYLCDACRAEVAAVRVEAFDAIADPSPGDWLRAGHGHVCTRCFTETHNESDGRAVGSEAVCEECLTLADWDIIDPERAAEMRAYLAEDDES